MATSTSQKFSDSLSIPKLFKIPKSPAKAISKLWNSIATSNKEDTSTLQKHGVNIPVENEGMQGRGSQQGKSIKI